MSNSYYIEIVENLRLINPKQWDQMNTSEQPFLTHAFLSGLEETACVSDKTGWIPQHIVIFTDD